MAVRLIVFTVVVLGFVNAYSFVRLYSSTFVADKNLMRGPAAIKPTGLSAQDLKSHLKVDLNCGLNKKPELKVKGPWAQLKGRMCKPKKSDKVVVEITNMNNGFTASVFDLGVQEYQTDLIQLDQGSNKIRVRFVSPRGAVEEQTLVIESNYI